MVQFKDVLTGAEKRSYTRAVDYQRCPARRRQAQRLRGGRPHAAPPHALRDARQLELRRLLQARGDPLGLGLPDPRPRDPAASAWPPRPTRTTTSPATSGATRSACRPERMARWGDCRRRRRQELLADGRHRAVRAVQRDPLRPRRAALARARSASRTTASTARAGSRSGTSCSWSSTSSPDGRWSRCRSRASTPAWAWSASPASSSRSRPTTTRTCSRRSTPGCASCSATTRTPSRRSASATRSSPTTRAR